MPCSTEADIYSDMIDMQKTSPESYKRDQEGRAYTISFIDLVSSILVM